MDMSRELQLHAGSYVAAVDARDFDDDDADYVVMQVRGPVHDATLDDCSSPGFAGRQLVLGQACFEAVQLAPVAMLTEGTGVGLMQAADNAEAWLVPVETVLAVALELHTPPSLQPAGTRRSSRRAAQQHRQPDLLLHQHRHEELVEAVEVWKAEVATALHEEHACDDNESDETGSGI